MCWCHKYVTKAGFPIDQIYFKQLFNTSIFTKEQCLSKITEIILSVNYIPIERALGILWNPEMDTFYIKYTIKSVIAVKRGILSLISSIFDPLGLTAPALIEPKWIIKQLWKRKTDWDELLPLDLTKRWQKWLDNLPDLKNITLDR